MRAIDADELKKCVLKWLPQDPCGKEEKEMPFETDICVSMLMEIDEQPTIQPKRGKWIKTARWGRVYYCNQCRNYLDFDGVNAGRGSTNFCPNCGAKMEVDDE